VLAGRFLGRGLRYRRRIECTHSVHSARFSLAGRTINCGIERVWSWRAHRGGHGAGIGSRWRRCLSL